MSKLGATSLHGRRGRASAKAAATTTAEARSATRTPERWLELSRSSTLLTTKVTRSTTRTTTVPFPVTKPWPVPFKARWAPWAVTRRTRAKRAARRPGRLLERGRHDLRWQVEVVAEVLNAIVGEVPVVVLPGEGLPDVLLGLEALHELDHLQVGHVNLRVLRQVVVLLGVQHALFEEVLADLIAVLLRDDHGGQAASSGSWSACCS